MSYSKVQIANLALAKCGDESAQITSFEDDSKEANLVMKFYEPALREVLRMHAWNCAKRRAELVLTTETPVFGWENQFALPADCVRPLAVASDSGTQRFFRENSEWVVEGKKILSNHDQLYLLYIRYITDPNQMDELFIRTLYTHLAVKLCYPLTEDATLLRTLVDEIKVDVWPEARRVNSFEGYESPSVDSEWIEATHNGGSMSNSYPPFAASSYGTL